MLDAITLLGYADPNSGSGTLTLVLIVVGAAIIVAVALLVRWVVGRSCPRCGKRVGRGKLDCPHCGFDFRSIGASAAE